MKRKKNVRCITAGLTVLAAITVAGCGGGNGGGISSSVPSVNLLGLTASNQLVRFSSATPGTINATIPVTGLQAGENLLGIDYRPANGLLYGLGSTSRLYSINAATGAAVAVGVPFAPLLNGASFGFDFNPTVDRIRVTSDTQQNLRLNPDTGATAATDTSLAYAAADVNFGKDPDASAAAYTNSIASAASTTLYVIDTKNDVLAVQSPPNNGTLNTVGPLGIDVSGVTGFDIASPVAMTPNIAYAALVSGGVTQIYTINLSNGSATLAASFPGPGTLTGLAIVP